MLYDRRIRRDILKYMDDKGALVILGSRQVGKTSLLKLLMEDLKPKAPVFYYDLEEPRILEVLDAGVDDFLQFLRAEGADLGRRNFVLLDEIQYLRDPSKFIKLIVDHHSDKVKLVVTGSSALGIKMKFRDSLVGRKLVFHLYPLDFREMLVFKGQERLSSLLPEDAFTATADEGRFYSEDYRRYLLEFLVFGGYPRVVLEDDVERKVKFLGEIVSTYIYRDVSSLFQLEDISKFNQLLKVLAAQVGNLLNISNISNAVGIARQTVSRYISILEDTFVISLLPPYFTNPKKEITKSPKVYFLDNGVRNYLLGDLSRSESRGDMGKLFENLVYSGLVKHKGELERVHFWRTQNGAEVDFVLEREAEVFPIEAKWKGRRSRAMGSFMQRYRAKRGYVVHSGDFVRDDGTRYLPAWWIV